MEDKPMKTMILGVAALAVVTLTAGAASAAQPYRSGGYYDTGRYDSRYDHRDVRALRDSDRDGVPDRYDRYDNRRDRGHHHDRRDRNDRNDHRRW
jgi:opacity protein-like surface antigen